MSVNLRFHFLASEVSYSICRILDFSFILLQNSNCFFPPPQKEVATLHKKSDVLMRSDCVRYIMKKWLWKSMWFLASCLATQQCPVIRLMARLYFMKKSNSAMRGKKKIDEYYVWKTSIYSFKIPQIHTFLSYRKMLTQAFLYPGKITPSLIQSTVTIHHLQRVHTMNG